MKAAEREAVEAVAAEGRVGIGAIEAEIERFSSLARVTRPVVTTVAGAAQGAIRTDIPATDKEAKIVQLNDLG